MVGERKGRKKKIEQEIMGLHEHTRALFFITSTV
jgi:hypothetical protein